MDLHDIQNMPWPDFVAFVRDLEAKYAAHAPGPHAPDAPPQRTLEANHPPQDWKYIVDIAGLCEVAQEVEALRANAPSLPPADRQAFLDIAMLCKRALEQPPFSSVHRQYFFDIARVCKRLLDREG